MKAVLLAAGEGTRLKPLTNNIPKVMLLVDEKPVLEHNINLLVKHKIRDIAINLYYLPKKIKKYFKNGKNWGINIFYSEEKKILGTAGALKNLSNFLDSSFVVVYGDVISNVNISEMIEFHKKKGCMATIALYEEKENPQAKGLVEIDDNQKILKFIEKPENPPINLANAGIYIFEPEILDFIPENKFFDCGHDLFPLLISNKKYIYGYLLKDEYLIDIGTIKNYNKINKDIKNKKLIL